MVMGVSECVSWSFHLFFLEREEEGAWNLVGREGRKDLERVTEGKRHNHNILYKKKSFN